MRGSRSLRFAYESARLDGSPHHTSRARNPDRSSSSTPSRFIAKHHFFHPPCPPCSPTLTYHHHDYHHHHTSQHYTTTSPPARHHFDAALPSDNIVTTRASTTHIAVWALGTAFVLLVVDTRHQFRPPIPVPPPSRDTSLNHHHSISAAFGNHILPTCRRHPPPISAPTMSTRPNLSHDTGVNHHRASVGPWEQHASACRRHPATDRSAATPEITPPHLCRSLCFRPASLPYEHHHRRRLCSQLARDRPTAHSVPAARKPLLRPQAWGPQALSAPPGNVSPFFFVHIKTKCALWLV